MIKAPFTYVRCINAHKLCVNVHCIKAVHSKWTSWKMYPNVPKIIHCATICYGVLQNKCVTVLHWGVIQNKRHHKALTHVTCVATTWGCECLAVLKGLQLNRHWVLCKCSTLWCGRIGFVSKGKHFGLAGSQACILFWVRVSDSGRPGWLTGSIS